MKVTIGTHVQTEFGEGPIVAMSEGWCIVRREGARGKKGNRSHLGQRLPAGPIDKGK